MTSLPSLPGIHKQTFNRAEVSAKIRILHTEPESWLMIHAQGQSGKWYSGAGLFHIEPWQNMNPSYLTLSDSGCGRNTKNMDK